MVEVLEPRRRGALLRRHSHRLPLLPILFVLSFSLVLGSFWLSARINLNGKVLDSGSRISKLKKGSFASQKIGVTLRANSTISIPSAAELAAFYSIPSDGTNLWDDMEKLPTWIKQYLNWHKHKMQSLSNADDDDEDSLQTERWLVMQCLAGQDYKKCGGTADRLKPLPWALRMAYLGRRILVIRWTRPAPLERFLLPPVGGLDWRAPPFLQRALENVTIGKKAVAQPVIYESTFRDDISVLRTRFQAGHSGSEWYNEQLLTEEKEPSFEQVFHDVWRLSFTPATPIRTILQNEMERMDLVPGQYTSIHLRALYNTDKRPAERIMTWTENAIRCASHLQPQIKSYFFTSDSADARAFAMTYGGPRSLTVGTRTPNPDPPLHLDKASSSNRPDDMKRQTQRPASDFYDTFVDLYLLASGSCVTYNVGGFGKWASLISQNSSCVLVQDQTSNGMLKTPCQWHQDTTNGGASEEAVSKGMTTPSLDGHPLFPPPVRI